MLFFLFLDEMIEFKGKCYKFSAEKKTWQDARQQCVAQGADLVKIDDKDENDFLKNHSDDNTWIGLQKDIVGIFRWTDGTKPR